MSDTPRDADGNELRVGDVVQIVGEAYFGNVGVALRVNRKEVRLRVGRTEHYFRHPSNLKRIATADEVVDHFTSCPPRERRNERKQ